jgi:hypothetical protein
MEVVLEDIEAICLHPGLIDPVLYTVYDEAPEIGLQLRVPKKDPAPT